MRYELRKEWAAGLSLLSVFGTVLAAASLGIPDLLSGLLGTELDSITWFAVVSGVATLAAALAAIGNIMVSRRLARQRERRQIFLVYAREDLEAARNLASELRGRGFHPWLDVEQIAPGQVWKEAVLTGLEESSTALVLVSEHLAKKGFVELELEIALKRLQEQDRGLSPVIPVRLDKTHVPKSLAHIQWVDLFDENSKESLFLALDRATKAA